MTLSLHQSSQWLVFPPPPCSGLQSSASGMHSESASQQLLHHGNTPIPRAVLLSTLQVKQGTPPLTKKGPTRSLVFLCSQHTRMHFGSEHMQRGSEHPFLLLSPGMVTQYC